MMVFSLKYRKPIDSITADKSLKLRKYELDNEGWGIVEQLVSVLQVNSTVLSVQQPLTRSLSNTSRQHYTFPRIRPV
jgi:hypothetical protein